MRSVLLMMLMSSGSLFAQGRSYRYLHLDVFTDRVLTGNQLAVFLAPQGLSHEEMMLIAREINFSETTFVLPAEASGTDFRVRIFTPTSELDFAGHPTIGTAFALASAGKIAPGKARVVLGEGIGPVPLDPTGGEGVLPAWMYQLEPTFGKPSTTSPRSRRRSKCRLPDIEATGLLQEELRRHVLFVPMATAPPDRASRPRGAGRTPRSQMQRRGVPSFEGARATTPPSPAAC
jgi:hypothetical protein